MPEHRYLPISFLINRCRLKYLAAPCNTMIMATQMDNTAKAVAVRMIGLSRSDDDGDELRFCRLRRRIT